jgi:hypothetical protein
MLARVYHNTLHTSSHFISLTAKGSLTYYYKDVFVGHHGGAALLAVVVVAEGKAGKEGNVAPGYNI